MVRCAGLHVLVPCQRLIAVGTAWPKHLAVFAMCICNVYLCLVVHGL